MRIVDPAENYEDTAQAWARHLDQPFPTDAYGVYMCVGLMQGIWRNIDEETLEAIEVDPAQFAARVAAYRHNLAMEGRP